MNMQPRVYFVTLYCKEEQRHGEVGLGESKEVQEDHTAKIGAEGVVNVTPRCHVMRGRVVFSELWHVKKVTRHVDETHEEVRTVEGDAEEE
ncbi:Hypothetical protein POVN_LOCUS468 [uncultured virus]|nr:Hypothetical protein POVN_LOCUS468 [uncultured virus]